jgi:hypothetical protein
MYGAERLDHTMWDYKYLLLILYRWSIGAVEISQVFFPNLKIFEGR